MIERRADYEPIRQGDHLRIHGLRSALKRGAAPAVENATNGHAIPVRCELSRRQVGMVLAGGLFNWMRGRFGDAPGVLAPGP